MGEVVLRIPSLDANPLRVTFMFADGSVFTYFESRDAIGARPVLGTWKAPLTDFAQSLAESAISGWMVVMRRELGDIVAVMTTPRDDVADITCEECGGGGYVRDHGADVVCTKCDGSGRQPWPTQ